LTANFFEGFQHRMNESGMIDTPQSQPLTNLPSIRSTFQQPFSYDLPHFLNFHRQPFRFAKTGDSFDLGGNFYV
jgi:hypothetical protein